MWSDAGTFAPETDRLRFFLFFFSKMLAKISLGQLWQWRGWYGTDVRDEGVGILMYFIVTGPYYFMIGYSVIVATPYFWEGVPFAHFALRFLSGGWFGRQAGSH